MARPISIENRWDILYRDYPEVYDAFSTTPYQPTIYEQLSKMIDLRGRSVADAGAGTGLSSMALSRYAGRVIGIEKETRMLRLAKARLPAGDPGNIAYLAGDALALPLANASVDLVVGITLALYPPEQYRDFIREGLRTATGQVIYLGITPGWYGGELVDVINHPADDLVILDKIFLDEFHFSYQDFFSVQEYGSVEHIVNTYGFIFGKRVIDHLRAEKKTSIRWNFRIYSRNVD